MAGNNLTENYETLQKCQNINQHPPKKAHQTIVKLQRQPENYPNI